MGERDEVWWQSKAFKRVSNAELVKNGVFAGKCNGDFTVIFEIQTSDYKIPNYKLLGFLSYF